MVQPATPMGGAHPIQCRVLIDSPASGPWNMAVDEALLLDAATNGIAALRFYGWDEPTLSLGYFQHYEDRRQHEASRECPIVRRQTGGGAILHDGELTYSLALPPAHPLARDSHALYAAVHDAFIAVLAPWIRGRDAAWTLLRREDAIRSPRAAEPFLCFQRRARGDVALVSAHNPAPRSHSFPFQDFKVLGSAQRRHRGAILQHGSLLVEKSPAAPEISGIRDLVGVEVDLQRVIGDLIVRLADALKTVPAQPTRSNSGESAAVALANTKYGSSTWTKRR